MLSLLALVLGLVVYGVAVAVCWRERAWQVPWENRTARGIGLSSSLVFSCAGSIRGDQGTIVGVIVFLLLSFFFWWLLLWPLLGASVLFGSSGGYSIEGTKSNFGWMPCAGGVLVVVGLCLLITFLLKVGGGWQAHGGFTFSSINQVPQYSGVVGVWTVLIYFLLASLEETLYRGVLLRWFLVEVQSFKYRRGIALLISSTLFYFGHGAVFSAPKFAQIIFLGMGFGWLSLRHGLWASLLAHFAFNLASDGLFPPGA